MSDAPPLADVGDAGSLFDGSDGEEFSPNDWELPRPEGDAEASEDDWVPPLLDASGSEDDFELPEGGRKPQV